MTADLGRPSFAQAPALPDGGTLVWGDADELAASSTDLGNLAVAVPGGILRPGGPNDVAVLAGWCAANDIPVKARGSGYTVAGQGLCPSGGVQVAMRSLAQVRTVDEDVIDVDAGCRLLDVVEAAAARGRRVRTGAPSCLRRTVGGALSVGAVPQMPAEGSFLESVRDLQVATCDGQLVWCSPTRAAQLFHQVLGGMGEGGIITRVRLELVAMPSRVRTWDLLYDDIGDLLNDMRRLTPVADECHAGWQHGGADPVYHLVISTHYDADTALTPLPAGLRALGRTVRDDDYLHHATRATARLDQLMDSSWSSTTKVWLDFFVPDRSAEDALARIVPILAGEDHSPTGHGVIRPHRRHAFTRGGLELPAAHTADDLGELVFFVGLRTDSTGTVPDRRWLIERLLSASDHLQTAAGWGGVAHPAGLFMAPSPRQWATAEDRS